MTAIESISTSLSTVSGWTCSRGIFSLSSMIRANCSKLGCTVLVMSVAFLWII